MSTPVIGVLALQGDVREHLIALAAADAVARPVRRPEELAEVDGLVLPGGESTTISKLAILFGVMEPLRARVRDGMPVYGTCAGMIMLADKILDPRSGQETVGGIDMIVRRNAFGRQNESFEAAVDVHGIQGDPVEGVFIRAPWVESVGARAEVLAEHEGHIVAVRQGNALATSFHPELTGDHRVHALFADMVRRSVPDRVIAPRRCRDTHSSVITLKINGETYALPVDHRTTLLDALRERLALTGTKKGCDQGQCGACTVLSDGRRVLACLQLAVAAEGREITTVEGVADGERLHPVQQAFLDLDGFQCGYCTPGQICSAIGVIAEHAAGWPSAVTDDLRPEAGPPPLTADEIRERMSGNLCRCGAYVSIVAAVARAAEAGTPTKPAPAARISPDAGTQEVVA